MLGIDISNWQAGFNITNSGVDFCIVKATEGVGFVDKTCDAFVQQCINNNIPFGYYHFNRTNNANKEAEFLIVPTTQTRKRSSSLARQRDMLARESPCWTMRLQTRTTRRGLRLS